MRFRFLCFVAVLALPVMVSAQSQPVFTPTAGLVCQPYMPCSGPGQCEQPGIPVCGLIATGAQVCVPSANTRYNLICCGASNECIDDHGVQGTCETIHQPGGGEDFSVCVWDTIRSFSFCRAAATTVTFSDIANCLGEVANPTPTLAQKILAGDCDQDLVLNADDACPCAAASSGSPGNGCPSFPDAGVSSDASVAGDASSSGDSGSTGDAASGSPQTQFGGGGGCDGCAARYEGGGCGPLAVLALAMLIVRRRHRARREHDANVRA